MTQPKIDRHSRVTLHYELQIGDGTVVDSTFGSEPLVFAMGDGQLLPNLEDCLIGLAEGEQTRILIPASEGFGYRSTEAIHDLPRSDFPEGLDPQPQQVIDFATPTGDSVPGMVIEVGDETVRVDFNHPLSGHDIQFVVHILAVSQPDPEQAGP
ncbi:MAG: FKBP-type peptidyl-prolyl cis-trans isomerase [Halothiobacillaceae bacterium]